VPKLWEETIEGHKRAVRDTALDATGALVAEHGLAGVTMSRVASVTGIGRATLYKYFPDVDAILTAWHERQVAAHLERLTTVRDTAEGPGQRLKAVLEAYALMSQHHEGSDTAALLHRGEHVDRARQALKGFIEALLADCAHSGEVRTDVPPDELAAYALHALTAAAELRSKAAAHRLVGLTLAALRPPAG
jgi:AcrR family transcriptional regulator